MSNKNIFVFGGTGSIGKALSKKLKSNNYDPIIISRNETELILLIVTKLNYFDVNLRQVSRHYLKEL